jgi:hypothetical protein
MRKDGSMLFMYESGIIVSICIPFYSFYHEASIKSLQDRKLSSISIERAILPSHR